MSGDSQRRTERDGAARWLTVHDDLLRGLTHALSNRVGTIAGRRRSCSNRSRRPAMPGRDAARRSERLDALLRRCIRLLPRTPTSAVAEPVMPTDVARPGDRAAGASPRRCATFRVDVTARGRRAAGLRRSGALVLAMAVAVGAAQRCRRQRRSRRVDRIQRHGNGSHRTRAAAAGRRRYRASPMRCTLALLTSIAVTVAAHPVRAATARAADGGVMAIVPTLQAARRARLGVSGTSRVTRRRRDPVLRHQRGQQRATLTARSWRADSPARPSRRSRRAESSRRAGPRCQCRTPPRSHDTTTMRMPPSIRIESPSRRPRISIAGQTIARSVCNISSAVLMSFVAAV